jgi:cation diffusion facilitator CzcD-associated flavoprotein CzcO
MTNTDLVACAAGWVDDFQAALTDGDVERLQGLFLPDAHWRDLLAFTWRVDHVHGASQIAEELIARGQAVQPSDFAIDPDRTPPSAAPDDENAVDFFISFQSGVGSNGGVVRLIADPSVRSGVRAQFLATILRSIRDHEENLEPHPGLGWDRPDGSFETWPEFRERHESFVDRDPQVLIVGGGQSGLSVAARLQRLGIDYLVIDRNPRPGDNWRNRYESLALHGPSPLYYLPYFPHPAFTPENLPKDRFADYLESYVRMFGLVYWGGAEFTEASFDDAAQRWKVTLRRDDGSVREMHPEHLVMATGDSGTRPFIPELKGLEDFGGRVLHSSEFKSGSEFHETRALVVGVGTSGHDIALDLYRHDAEVTILQRSPTTVISLETSLEAYPDHNSLSAEEVDDAFLMSLFLPEQLMGERLRGYNEHSNQKEAELYEALEAVGMRIDTDVDNGGWVMKFHRYHGRYYLDVGCSGVIASGGIAVKQTEDIETFIPTGIRMVSGATQDFDIVVLATGYNSLNEDVENRLGPEIGQRVGQIGGLTAEGEIGNIAQPTGQQNLWFIFGGIPNVRVFSQLLALQLKGRIEGVAPAFVRQADGSYAEVEPTVGV